MKKEFNQKDLSSFDNKSITQKVESLIPQMEKMTKIEIETEFTSILNDPEVSVSKATKQKWMLAMQSKNKTALMFIITNCYLAGCDLKVI